MKKIILPGEVPLSREQFEERYSVPDRAVVPAGCIPTWIGPSAGESALSWWKVEVWLAPLRPPMPPTATYRIKALDDSMAAREGLRAFEREHAAGLIRTT